MDEKQPDHIDPGQSISEKQEPQIQRDESARDITHASGIFPVRTSDPLDPLNWSGVRKNSILAIVCLKYFLFTYITTTT